ncbi:Rho/RAC guanine nucleotide exchange factor [Entamoeba marina]
MKPSHQDISNLPQVPSYRKLPRSITTVLNKHTPSTHSFHKKSKRKPKQTPNESWDQSIKLYQRRLCAIQNLIHTERSMLTGIDYLLNNYKAPLENSGIITQELWKTLFHDLQSIKKIHENLFDVFIQHYGALLSALLPKLAFLKVHQSFIAESGIAVSQWSSEVKKNQQFNEFCFAAARKSGNQTYDLLMQAIVSRTSKYVSMFNEIEKYTPKGFPSKDIAVKAAGTFSKVVRLVNVQVAINEDMHGLIDIGNKYPVLKDDKFLNMEGNLIKSTPIIIFSDVMIVLRNKKSIDVIVDLSLCDIVGLRTSMWVLAEWFGYYFTKVPTWLGSKEKTTISVESLNVKQLFSPTTFSFG